MWKNNSIQSAIRAFNAEEAINEDLYKVLPAILEETPIYKMAYPHGGNDTEKALQNIFKEYVAYYRSHDEMDMIHDRFNTKTSVGKRLTDQIFTLTDQLVERSDSEKAGLFLLHTSLSYFCMRGMISYLSGMICYSVLMDKEEYDLTKEQREGYYGMSSAFMEDAQKSFAHILETLRDVEANMRMLSQGKAGSFIIHMLMGFGSEKLFENLKELIVGESPFQLLPKVQQLVKDLALCEDKLNHFTEVFKNNNPV